MLAIKAEALKVLLEKYGDRRVRSIQELNALLVELAGKEGYHVEEKEGT